MGKYTISQTEITCDGCGKEVYCAINHVGPKPDVQNRKPYRKVGSKYYCIDCLKKYICIKAK